MPYNCQFQPMLTLNAQAGLVVRIRQSNPQAGNCPETKSYTTIAGTQTCKHNEWVSGEGVVYTIPAGVTVTAAQYDETGFDTKFTGSFWCNDSDYNVLWKKATRTCYVAMRERFWDCPDRERAFYKGDASNEIMECFYAFDTKAYELMISAIRNYLWDGTTYLEGHHLMFHGKYFQWPYYLYTGDLSTIAYAYPTTRKCFLVDLASKIPMANPSCGWGCWFDWGDDPPLDYALLEYTLYYTGLDALKKQAQVTGNTADIPAIDAKLTDMKNQFDTKFLHGTYYMSSQITSPDDRANAMAVLSGLADTSRWAGICEVLKTARHASPFMERFVLEALCVMGREQDALARMYERYKSMIDATFTTCWEHFGKYNNTTLNHGWNAPNYILSAYIAGVAPETPAYATYHVLPQEGFLTSIKVNVPSIKGDIPVEISKTASQYSLTLTSPAGTKAIVGIPKKSFSTLDQIKINGTAVWNGAYTGGVTGVSWNGEDSRYVKFNVDPGAYAFAATGTLSWTTPKPAYVLPPRETVLDKKTWTATASVNPLYSDNYQNDIIADLAESAIDGDHWYGWTSVGGGQSETQHPGQWFMVDMKQPQSFCRIALDNLWFMEQYPRGYEVYVSNDGAAWGNPIASGSGQWGYITSITFPKTTARYIKIVQTGTANVGWAIVELDVYRDADQPVFSAVALTPRSATIAPGQTLQFAASAVDQYSTPLATQPAPPAFSWTVSGQGTISPSGLFTAGQTEGGLNPVITATVTIGGKTAQGSAQVLITGKQQGLNYAYYEGAWQNLPNFATPTPNKTGTVNDFDISVAAKSDSFALRFTGFINCPVAGDYTFYTSSDDGSALYIDNQRIVNNDGTHGAIEASGRVTLTAGFHALTVCYFQGNMEAALSVSWTGPGIQKENIPAEALYTDEGATAFRGAAPIDMQPAVSSIRLSDGALHMRITRPGAHTVSVMTLTGAVVKSFSGIGPRTYELTDRTFASGAYVLNVKIDGVEVSRKMLVR